jgi:ferritin-like protein
MQFFGYKHLPLNLQAVSKPFFDLASIMDVRLPDNCQKDEAIQKLLEAKDCAVRAGIFALA